MALHARFPASFGILLRSFGRNRSASAAVQFVFVAPLFFGLLFSIIEMALMFFAGQYLETINQDLARLIMTGQAQGGTYSGPADFLNKKLCNPPAAAPAMFTCSNLFIDVQNYTSFQNVTINSQIDGSKNFINNMKYCPGNAGDIVVVRMFYQWPTFVTSLGFNLSNLSGNMVLLSATAAFKNEPFVANPSAC
jgi:Flp pilus assembly protein TadG